MLYLDLESRSQCDLIKHGLRRYVTDPTTQVICMAYCFEDTDIRFWWSDEPFPVEVSEHFVSGGPIMAWNSNFEQNMFEFVVCNDYDVPTPKPNQWRCAMTVALVNGYPGGLGDAVAAAGLPVAKMAEGRRLIKEYSAPGHKTELVGKDRELMKDYCETDVITMVGFLAGMRDLTNVEWSEFHLNCKINDRGIPVDVKFAEAATKYADALAEHACNEVAILTGGAMQKITARKARDAWLFPKLTEHQKKLLEVYKNGEKRVSLDQDHRALLLACDDLDPYAHDLLTYMNDAGSSSLKKYQVAVNTHVDGIVHDTLVFNGAQTGRFASRGLQIHNLRRDCFPLEEAEAYIGQAVAGESFDGAGFVLARLLRSMITHKDGLIWVDWSGIESRVAPWLADSRDGERVLDIHRSGADLYVAAAAGMFHVSVDSVTKDQRQAGKVAVLACVAEGSMVLTRRNLIPIEEILPCDEVWDGVEWVTQEGVVYKGYKEVILYDGLEATEDHKVWTQCGRYVQFGRVVAEGWKLAKTGLGRENIKLSEVNQPRHRGVGWSSTCTYILYNLWCGRFEGRKQLRKRARWLPSLQSRGAQKPPPKVVAETAVSSTRSLRKLVRESVSKLRRSGYRFWFSLRSLCGRLRDRTSRFAEKLGIGPRRQQQGLLSGEPSLGVAGAAVREHPTEHSEYRRQVVGGKWEPLRTPHDCETATLESVSVSDRRKSKASCCTKTKELVQDTVRTRKVRVYDLVNAGPRHRYTVSNTLVSNCGYGGGANALISMAKNYGMTLDEDDAKAIVDAWRDSNHWACELWYDFDAAIEKAVMNPRTPVKVGRVTLTSDGHDFLWCELPSGRMLPYPKPRMEYYETPWGEERYGPTHQMGLRPGKDAKEPPRKHTRGANVMQNSTQAISADLLRDALLRVDAAGLDIVLHCHDEIVIRPRGAGDGELLNEIMLALPWWATNLPLDTGGVEGSKRYGK